MVGGRRGVKGHREGDRIAYAWIALAFAFAFAFAAAVLESHRDHQMPSSSNVPSPAPKAVNIERFYSALANIGDLVALMPQPQALYAGIVDIFERHVGALLVLVGEIDYGAGVMRRRAPAQAPAGEEDIYPESVPVAFARSSFWEGKIDVEPNIADAPGREAMRPAYARHGIRSSAAVPVHLFGKIHTVLILRSSTPEFFTPELLQLLERIALSISHALEGDAQRTCLQQSLLAAERSQHALRLLSETLKVATHPSAEHDLLSEACRVVVDVGAYPVCWMGLLTNDSAQTLELRAHAGRGAESYRSLTLSLAWGATIILAGRATTMMAGGEESKAA